MTKGTRAKPLVEAVEDTVPEAINREIAEEAFDHVEPRGGNGREVDVEERMLREPATHLFVFMGGVVVRDQVQLFVIRGAGRRSAAGSVTSLGDDGAFGRFPWPCRRPG